MTEVVEDTKNAVKETKGRVGRIWTRLKDRNPWLVHVLRAYQRLTAEHGNHYAAAITYFSFLALFPLILLAVSILGFVLHSQPDLQTKLLTKVSTQAPGGFGDTLKTAINSAIANRASVGVVGVVGVALTGAGWISNLRAAIDAVWGIQARKRNFLKAKLADLGVLAGLGVALLVSLALTAVGTALTGAIIRAVGLDGVFGVALLVKLLGIAIAVVGDMLIFGWVLVWLPDVEVPRGVVLRGTLLAAAGFEVLKVVGTYTIAASSHSVTAGPFGSLLAILVWIQLVSRYMLFCVAWMAITQIMAAEEASSASVDLAKVDTPAPVTGALSPAGVAGTLIGAGAAAGGAAVAWMAHRRTVRDVVDS